MKKTEKIEVRLSHEEKTALTTLADQEGRSVSDLVRGLIERYMSINTTHLPRKTPWLKFVAIAAAGFFAGHIATYLIAQSHQHAPIHYISIAVGTDKVSFPILDKAGEVVNSIIPSNDGDLLVEAVVEEQPESIGTVEISLCRKTDTKCELIAKPSLKLNPNFQSAINFKDVSGQGVHMVVSPPH